MKVIQLETSFGIDRLVFANRSEPDNPGPDQVLVRMASASLNARDYLTVIGRYNPRQPLPLIPCSDGAGRVVAVGSGVQRFRTGDRVMPCFAQGWADGPLTESFRSTSLGGPLDGTLTEYMMLDQSGLVTTPEYLSDIEASCLPCAAVTAWNAIIDQGKIGKDDTVVVQGTGGVALFALQFAAAVGARVIVLSKSDAKLDRARELGASEVINYIDTPEWSRTVKDLTGGAGADHVVELGGRATLRQSVRAVRPAGTISLIGVLGGPVAELDLPLVVMRNVRLQGVTVGSRSTFESMTTFLESSRIRPVIDRTFSLADAREAFLYMETATHFGKICINLPSS